MNGGDTLHVRDLALPADTTTTANADDIVCTVRVIVVSEEPTAPAEGDVEPEVIGRPKTEEEAEG